MCIRDSSLIGVVAGLYLTGTTITVIVLIGSVMLAGIVVNNSIVLIEAINRLRRKGVAKFNAVLTAGHLRLRPILMTTLTNPWPSTDGLELGRRR